MCIEGRCQFGVCRLKALVLQNRRLLSKYAAEVVVQVRDMEESHGTLSESRKEPPRHVNICAFNRPRGFSDGQGPSDVLKLFIQPRQFEVFLHAVDRRSNQVYC